MKKTYLIKDQGKGLVENLTPNKLFDIASGGSSNGNNPTVKVKIENYDDGKIYQENDVVYFNNESDINGIARSKFNDNNTYPFKLNYDEVSFRKIQAVSKYSTHGNYYLTLDESEVITNGENIFVTLNPGEFGILIKNAQDINTAAIPLFEEEENYTLIDRYSNSNRFDNDISDLYFNENMDIFYKQKWELIAQINEPNDYSIYEQQVGKFIYPKELPNGFDLVSKPKYRIVVYSYLNTTEIDNITLSGVEIIPMPYLEQILSIQGNYNVDNKQIGFGESNFFKKYAAPHRTINERVNIGYYLENSNIIIYGYMKTIDPENIMPDTEFALANGIEGIITLEYTKTTDEETIIESVR